LVPGPRRASRASSSTPNPNFVPPYVGHRGWIGIRLDVEPDWDEITNIIRDAYRRVAPQKLAAQLD
jgi:predicted DNA-binding protein (MmcQ/YjbR family)